MSQLACPKISPPDSSLGPEGQWKSQSGHGDLLRNNDKSQGKKVRFKTTGALDNPVEPSSSEEDAELC